MDILLYLFQSYHVSKVVYTILALLFWYGILAFQYGINGGGVGCGRWWVFECFWEDILMNIPGGSKRKGEAIRRMVGETGDGSLSSLRNSWTHEELRKTGEYEVCGKAMFGSPILIWGMHIFYLVLAIYIGPAFICAVICMAMIGFIVDPVLRRLVFMKQ